MCEFRHIRQLGAIVADISEELILQKKLLLYVETKLQKQKKTAHLHKLYGQMFWHTYRSLFYNIIF